jgi:hypothetical protein
MTLKSYAVLLPCGVGLFTGVEFVCCPRKHSVANANAFDSDKVENGKFESSSNYDDQYDEDEYDDDDEDEDEEDEDDDYNDEHAKGNF